MIHIRLILSGMYILLVRALEDVGLTVLRISMYSADDQSVFCLVLCELMRRFG